MTPSSSVASASDDAGASSAKRPTFTGTRDREPTSVAKTGLIGWWHRNSREMRAPHWTIDIVFALFVEVVFGWPFVMLASSRVFFEPLLIAPWVLFFAALVLRRAAPSIAVWLCVFAVAFKAVIGLEPHGQDVAIGIVMYSASAYGTFRLRVISGILCGLLPALLLIVMAMRPMRSLFMSLFTVDYLGGPIVFAIIGAVLWSIMTFALAMCWLGGQLRRSQMRADEAAHRRELAEMESLRSREQLFVEQERNRIARDMHDVIAHSLAVVVAQADGGRYAMRTKPEAGEEALTTISETAREALYEVRGLLSQLRHSQPEGPQRGFADVPTVLQRMTAAGLRIEVESKGTPRPLGKAADNAMFRLVQESLTNALRHGDPRGRTLISIIWDDNLHVRIVNAINPVPPPPRPDSGHGLIGMRERILTAGGRLEVGRQGDQFVVTAMVPTAPATAPSAPKAGAHPEPDADGERGAADDGRHGSSGAAPASDAESNRDAASPPAKVTRGPIR